MPGIPSAVAEHRAGALFARPEVREALAALVPYSANDRALLRTQLVCMNVDLTVDEIEIIDAVLPTITSTVMWPTDGVRCCDPDVLMAVAEHLVAKFRAAEACSRKPVDENDLCALFAAIDPTVSDVSRQILTGRAVNFRNARQLDDAEAVAVYRDTLGLVTSGVEDIPAVQS